MINLISDKKVFIALVIILLLSIGAFLVVRNQNPENPVRTNPIVATDTSTNINIFLGAYKGEEALFLRKNDDAVGYVKLRKGGGWPDTSFAEFENPKQVFSLTTKYAEASIDNFNLDEAGKYLYISLYDTIADKEASLANKIIKINLEDLQSKEVFFKRQNDQRYPYGGGLHIDRIVGDDYLILSFYPQCGAAGGCDNPNPTFSYIVLNTAGPWPTWLYLHRVADLRFDFNAQTMKYRFVAPFKVPCLPQDYASELGGCAPNESVKVAYLPTGKDQVALLPRNNPMKDELPSSGLTVDSVKVYDGIAVYLFNGENVVGRLALNQTDHIREIGAKLSPNNKFILLSLFDGDGAAAWMYDIASGELHKMEQALSGIKSGEGWLADGRFDFWNGCALADSCYHYRSINAEKPWEVEKL